MQNFYCFPSLKVFTMKFLQLFLISIVGVASCQAGSNNVDGISKLVSLEQTIPRCGEVQNTIFGGIFYKPFEQILDNERCVWVIAPPGAINYTVTLQYLGAPTNEPNSEQELLVSGITHNDAVGSPNFTTIKPTGLGTYFFEDVNLIVITFVSGPQTGGSSAGFSLQYESSSIGNIANTSLLSTHHFIESPTFEFHYPDRTGNYDNNELAAFIFLPPNNINTGGCKDVWYKQQQIQASCVDSLFVYTFNKEASSPNEKWEETGQICDTLPNQHIPHDDLVLVLFQSDSTTVATGFWFWFTGC